MTARFPCDESNRQNLLELVQQELSREESGSFRSEVWFIDENELTFAVLAYSLRLSQWYPVGEGHIWFEDNNGQHEMVLKTSVQSRVGNIVLWGLGIPLIPLFALAAKTGQFQVPILWMFVCIILFMVFFGTSLMATSSIRKRITTIMGGPLYD